MRIMNDQGYAQLRIEVRTSPETNDYEVGLMADGESLVDRFSTDLIGLDPDDLLTDSCGLRAENESHRVTIGRCSCGVIGCGNVEVDIRSDHEQVIWTATDSSQQVRFLAAQYDAEVELFGTVRGRRQSVQRPGTVLARRGFEFSWASGRCRDGMMTASLGLTPGPYQVLVSVPWDGENIDGMVAHFAAILSQSSHSITASRSRSSSPLPISLGTPRWMLRGLTKIRI